ncbi:MAG: ABC transporter ATP-binding protein [Actinomycetota bacterium]|nr:ABC transporter ATP-binding protein [Actinomycetota bacterium]
MQSLIEMKMVSLYRSGRPVLEKINWSVQEGERWVIIGPNGAGKTSLLSLISTYAFPTSGSLTVLGNAIGKIDSAQLKPRIGIASSANLDLIEPDERVIDFVLSSAYGIFGRWNEDYDLWDESRAKALLTVFGIKELAERNFASLSEGERKRSIIARSLMSDPELLLMDEPTAGLDLGAREDLLHRISTFASDPSAPASVIVTHHLEEIPAGSTHILVLDKGKIFAEGKIDQILTSQLLSDLYGIKISLEIREGRFFARAY